MFTQFIYLLVAGVLLIKVGCVAAQNKANGEITLQVSHYKVPCTGESTQLCYQIRKNGGEKEFFYDEIEGFRYEWGFNYTLIVDTIIQPQPMKDATSIQYRLKKLVKKEKAAAGETFELPLRMDDGELIRSEGNRCSYFGQIGIQTGSQSCSSLAKAQSAVFRHHESKQELVLVQLK